MTTDELRARTEKGIDLAAIPAFIDEILTALDTMEAERDTANRTRDEARAASNRDLEKKRDAERWSTRLADENREHMFLRRECEEKRDTLRVNVATLRGALEAKRDKANEAQTDNTCNTCGLTFFKQVEFWYVCRSCGGDFCEHCIHGEDADSAKTGKASCKACAALDTTKEAGR